MLPSQHGLLFCIDNSGTNKRIPISLHAHPNTCSANKNTLVRICPNDTLLYIGGDDDHPDLAEMEKELQELRTLEGRPYRLLKLPLPRPIYNPLQTSPRGDFPTSSEESREGLERLPATYANYLVVNGAVLVPTYNQPDLDAEALRIVGLAFPDREIVGIDCRAVIRQHGSLHCCTMQYY